MVLSNPMHVEMALSKNRTYLGRRYIEIYRAKKSVGGRAGPVCMHALRQLWVDASL